MAAPPKSSDQPEINGRRFAVEEIDNGYLVKISLAGSDKYVGRYAFPDLKAMITWLERILTK